MVMVNQNKLFRRKIKNKEKKRKNKLRNINNRDGLGGLDRQEDGLENKKRIYKNVYIKGIFVCLIMRIYTSIA